MRHSGGFTNDTVAIVILDHRLEPAILVSGQLKDNGRTLPISAENDRFFNGRYLFPKIELSESNPGSSQQP